MASGKTGEFVMATGETKTTWNGNGSNHEPSSNDNGSDNAFEISLTYGGKRSESEILTIQPAHTDLVWEGQNATTNRLYYGDNLPILARLMEDSTVKGKVKLIYIDPPFSTNSVFKSRSQVDAYHDLLLGSHYLEFMRERLIFLRELLAMDGSIYVHIDDTMAFYLKVILDEVFGRKNFRNCITRRKCNPKNYTRKAYGNISEYIFFYTKSDICTWERPFELWRRANYGCQAVGGNHRSAHVH
jgi:adenine-specific DNA-methyltransferase